MSSKNRWIFPSIFFYRLYDKYWGLRENSQALTFIVEPFFLEKISQN